MPAQYVKPYVKTNKNDYIDAEAIAEAVGRAQMRFVPIKSDDQLDMQSLHRVRDRWVGRRTSVISQMRGLLLERGITFRKGRRHAEASLPGTLEDPENGLSGALRMLLAQLQSELRQLQSQIDEADALIMKAAGEHEACGRLMAIPGVGPLTATAVVAAIGNGAEFRKDDPLPHGWDWYRSSTPPEGSRSCWGSANAETAICGGFLCMGPVPCCSAGKNSRQDSVRGWVSSLRVLTATSWRSRWPTRWLASYGRCSPKARRIARRRCWQAQLMQWPADDPRFTQYLTRSAGEQRDGKMVEPGTLETCNTEKPFEAVKLGKTRVQRIPSRSRASAQSKTGYICADQTVIFTFRLRQSGGPYIPYCRPPCESIVKGRHRCPERARESAQCVMSGFVVRRSRISVEAIRHSRRKSQRRQSAILLASILSFFFLAAAMARCISG